MEFQYLYICILCFGINWQSMSQQNGLKLLDSSKLDADTFVGVDKFDNTYYLDNNTLFKQSTADVVVAFQDLLLGDISRVDILNPNKIIVFYQMANVVIILDNRMTEIDRQDFNTHSPFKNVSHVGTSKDQSLWIYNVDLNQLELFDYRLNRSIARSLPIDEDILGIRNNFNYCFLLTAESVLIYNIYGSLVKHLSLETPKTFDVFKNRLIVHTAEGLEIYNQNFELKEVVNVNLEGYNSLFYKDEILYLYSENILSRYKIITKN